MLHSIVDGSFSSMIVICRHHVRFNLSIAFLMRWRRTRKSIQLSGLVFVPYHFTITPFFLMRATEWEKICHGQLRSSTGDGKKSNENGCT